MVQPSVDPIDAQVREADEKGELQEIIQGERSVRGCIVEFPIAPDFQKEEGSREERHERHGDHGLFDLEGDLVFEVFGVGEGGVVEDKKVGKTGADKVDDHAKDPARSDQSKVGGIDTIADVKHTM